MHADPSRDFASDQERTRRVVGALYAVLAEEAASTELRSIYKHWARLFGLATEYEPQKLKLERNPAARQSFQAFRLKTEKAHPGRFIFAIHTFFAIVAKLLA